MTRPAHDCSFISAPGGPEVLVQRRVPVPVPAHDEILIRVSAA